MPKPYSFGLVGAGLVCRVVVHHLFADHAKRNHVNDLYQIDFLEANQPSPMVNMVQIRTDLLDKMLHTILEESPEPYSEASTNSCPSFPQVWGESFSWLAMIALLSMERLVSSIVSVKPRTSIINDITMKKWKMLPKPLEVARRLSPVISNKSFSWWTISE